MTEQLKQLTRNFLEASGRGGFLTGTVSSTEPLSIKLETGLSLTADDLYITDSCIGLSISLKHRHGSSEEALQDGIVLRRPLAPGDGVLLLCRPSRVDGSKYILLDRLQPYTSLRGVSGR